MQYSKILKLYCWDFPGGPVIKTLCSTAGAPCSILGPGTKIPQAVWDALKKKIMLHFCQKSTNVQNIFLRIKDSLKKQKIHCNCSFEKKFT